MKQRIFIIHGWGGSPKKDWLPWAKDKLSGIGFEVFVPEMPDTDHPIIDLWVRKLRDIVGEPLSGDIFIGHSIGCQTILRYMERFTEEQEVKKVILVAPWWYLTLGRLEEPAVADPWLETLIDFERVKEKAMKFVCIFSDNDPYVPMKENIDFFKGKLQPEIIVKNKCGHFTEDDGIDTAVFLLDLIK